MIKEIPVSKLKKCHEYDRHTKVYKVEDKASGLKGFIAIHRQRSIFPALGATRLWEYKTEDDALNDALRLSRLMSYKAAMVGLPYTGGKAVLLKNNLKPEKREKFFRAYAKEIEKLAGKFVTGTDMGVANRDIIIMNKETKYVIGLGLDPAYYTAVGIVNGIQECLMKVYKNESIKGRSFAIQGLGKSGLCLARLLYKDAKEIFVTDINKDTVNKALKEMPKLKPVEPDEIYKQKVDVFSPCAMSRVVNDKTVKEFKCKIICGGANNQLDKKIVGHLLKDAGILYAPDYVVNAGGLLSVVDEFVYKKHNRARIKRKLETIRESLFTIFSESDRTGEPTNIVANKIAQELVYNK